MICIFNDKLLFLILSDLLTLQDLLGFIIISKCIIISQTGSSFISCIPSRSTSTSLLPWVAASNQATSSTNFDDWDPSVLEKSRDASFIYSFTMLLQA